MDPRTPRCRRTEPLTRSSGWRFGGHHHGIDLQSPTQGRPSFTAWRAATCDDPTTYPRRHILPNQAIPTTPARAIGRVLPPSGTAVTRMRAIR